MLQLVFVLACVVITEGYYIVDEGNWQEFQRDDEEQICNDYVF